MTGMSALLLDRPEPPGTAPADGDGWQHIWCCDPDVALCGADLSGVEDSDGEDEPVCTDCAIADALRRPCPVAGCRGAGDG